MKEVTILFENTNENNIIFDTFPYVKDIKIF